MVKDALPTQIHDELCFCHEDTSSFEGLKRAVLRIDNNYWKRSLEESIRPHIIHSSHAPPQTSWTDQTNPIPPANHMSLPNRVFGERSRPILPQAPTSRTDSSNSPYNAKLGPDGHLTPAECQRCMNLGLCMRCGQSGHLVRGCPKQNTRPSNTFEGWGIYLEQEANESKLSKKMDTVNSFPGESTA